MKAVQINEFGVENLAAVEIADPKPATGEVLIAAEAATINPADMGVVSGAMAANFPAGASAPYTPGWDVVGRVVAVGDGVDQALLHARVVGFSLWMDHAHGTQASLVALPVANIAVAPDGLESTALTTVGLNGLTAWRAVTEVDPTEGETVVVTGAAGSVGGFALELCVARGARVIAAVSARDRDTMLALGASDVAIREDGDLGAAVRKIRPGGADALLDTASIAGPALGAIRDGGRYVTVTVVPESERGITATRIIGVPNALALASLVEMASSGALHTPVAKTFPVSEVKAAYQEFAARPHRGRIVLTF